MARSWAALMVGWALALPVAAQVEPPEPPPSTQEEQEAAASDQDDQAQDTSEAQAASEAQDTSEAQDAAAGLSADTAVLDVSVGALSARIAALEQAQGIDEAARQSLLLLWREALASATNEELARANASKLQAAAEGAPAERGRVVAELAALPPGAEPSALGELDGLTLPELEARLEEASRLARAAEQLAGELESERSLRANRKREIPGLLADVREQLSELESAELPAADTDQALAQRAVGLASRRELQARVAALSAESGSYDARRDLLTARQDLALRRRALAQATEAALRTRADAARLAKREEEARQAEAELRALHDSHPAVKALAERESELTQLGLELESKSTATLGRLDGVAAEAELIRTQRQGVTDKLEKLGFTNVLGLLLRRHRSELPDPDAFRTLDDEFELAAVQDLVIQLEEERERLTDLDGFVSAELADDSPEPFADMQSLTAEVRARAEAYRARLDDVLKLAEARFEQLVSLDVEQHLLADRVRDYESFIGQRILWMPDAEPLGLGDLQKVPSGVGWIFTARAWAPIGNALALGYELHPERDAMALATLVLILALLPFFRLRLRRIAAAAVESPSVVPLLQALFHTGLAAALLPLMVFAVGWRLELRPELYDLGRALVKVAIAAVPFTLMAALALPSGLGSGHFGWPDESSRRLRRATLILGAIVLPCVVVGAMVSISGDAELELIVGRLSRLIMMGALAMYAHAVLRKGGPIVHVMGAARWSPQAGLLRPLGHLLCVIVPVSLMVMIVLGYTYAEQVVTQSLLESISLVMLLLLARGTLMRWLALQTQRVALRQEQAEAEEQAGDEADEDEEGKPPRRVIDVTAVSERARQVVGAGIFLVFIMGLWGIWDEVLPALGFLDEWSLWERVDEVSVLDEDGVATMAERVVGEVTLADLLLSVLLLAMTGVAVRNLPALLDILLLSHLPIQPGTAYAAKALLGYVLMFGGLVWVMGQMGLSWGQLQWLVASMGVGLGFGLQEVFANFISGLILLFERPVRVGDVVTVGTTQGVVTTIRMRATTVRDYSRRELLVPNRKFITEEVTNWTLSDAITRLVFPVSVRPGVDKELVRKTLLEAVAQVPEILDEPPAYAICLGYEDGVLRFEVRAYLGRFSDRLPSSHAVNCAIDDALLAAGIEVVPPQQGIVVTELGGQLQGRGRQASYPVGGEGDGALPRAGASDVDIKGGSGGAS